MLRTRSPTHGGALGTERWGGWGGGLLLPFHGNPYMGREVSGQLPELWGPPLRAQCLVLRGPVQGAPGLGAEVRDPGVSLERPQAKPGWWSLLTGHFGRTLLGPLVGVLAYEVGGAPSPEPGQHPSL